MELCCVIHGYCNEFILGMRMEMEKSKKFRNMSSNVGKIYLPQKSTELQMLNGAIEERKVNHSTIQIQIVNHFL